MAALTKDDIWKVIQMALGMLVIPLAGWVWNMNVEVAELRNDLWDAEEVIADSSPKKISGSDDNAETNHWNRKGHQKQKKALSSLSSGSSRWSRRNEVPLLFKIC